MHVRGHASTSASSKGGKTCCTRFACFKLPKVPGAKKVLCAPRKDVTWLARTEPVAKEVEFSHHWSSLKPIERKYIVLHERAHLKAGVEHTDAFYEELMKMVAKAGIPWKIAYEMESHNCDRKN
jgi:hypothetical protein